MTRVKHIVNHHILVCTTLYIWDEGVRLVDYLMKLVSTCRIKVVDLEQILSDNTDAVKHSPKRSLASFRRINTSYVTHVITLQDVTA